MIKTSDPKEIQSDQIEPVKDSDEAKSKVLYKVQINFPQIARLQRLRVDPQKEVPALIQKVKAFLAQIESGGHLTETALID